jgi:hypothetical protein
MHAAGDNWEKYLADTQVQPPSCDAATGSCGTQLASIFWVPFMVVCSFLLLSIVLAVVVDAYTMDHAPPEVSSRTVGGTAQKCEGIGRKGGDMGNGRKWKRKKGVQAGRESQVAAGCGRRRRPGRDLSLLPFLPFLPFSPPAGDATQH